MHRFLDALNTPIAVLGVLLVVVVVNVFLYLGYRSSEQGGGPQTTRRMETTQRAEPEEETKPATTPQSPAERSATPSASATASATASVTSSHSP